MRKKNCLEHAPELNIHEVFYWESLYKGKFERKEFREHHGLRVLSQVAVHNQLHREMFHGPPKPTRDEMHGIIDFLDNQVHESFKVDRFWGAYAVMSWSIQMEMENPAEAERYRDTRSHLAQQMHILSRKSVGIEEPTTEEMFHYGNAA